MKLATMLTVVMILLSGCTSHWSNVSLKPDSSGPLTAYVGTKDTTGCVAVMDDLRVKSNGQDVNASTEFQKRFITNLKDTQIFERVVLDPPTTKPVRYVNLALQVKEIQDTNQGSNTVKGLFIGLSLYLFTPVLPLSYDFESEMLLNATRWDGKTKQYTAKGKGSSSYHLFANAPMAGEEVRTMVTNNNINSLLNQMIRDTDFFYGL